MPYIGHELPNRLIFQNLVQQFDFTFLLVLPVVVDAQTYTVTVDSHPPVDGQSNAFEYPILSF